MEQLKKKIFEVHRSHQRVVVKDQRLRRDPAQAGVFVAGSMHDIGKDVMVNSYPGLFPLLLDEMRSKQWATSSMLHAEQEVSSGLTHTVTGEILIRKWGL